jgi:hypothetical protein
MEIVFTAYRVYLNAAHACLNINNEIEESQLKQIAKIIGIIELNGENIELFKRYL